MKTAKQRFNQRFATFKANLNGKLFINGKFRGRMILEDMVSSDEDLAPGESWSLGRHDDGYWVVVHKENEHAAEWIVSPGKSLESMEGIIPLPDDLRARFDRVIRRKSIAISFVEALIGALLSSGLPVISLPMKTSKRDFKLFLSHGRMDALYVDQSMGPRVYTVWRPQFISPQASNK